MESLQPQLDDVTSSIDDLEDALTPILSAALSASTSKLPLLDKAKLYVLATYAIESILFSFVRLNGVDAKSHPVFKELARVKAYFQKIQTAQDIGAGGRSARLDKDAAGRFIKAGLAGNDRYDRERAGRRGTERAGAKRKIEEMSQMGTHTRFEGTAKRIRASEGEMVNVVKASEADSEEDEEDSEEEVLPESLDEALRKARSKHLQQRGPLTGKKWDQATKEMIALDPESALEGSRAAGEVQGERPKKSKKGKKEKDKKKKDRSKKAT